MVDGDFGLSVSRVIETIGRQSPGESDEGGNWLQSRRKFEFGALILSSWVPLLKSYLTLKYSLLHMSSCSCLQSDRQICFGCLVTWSHKGNAKRHKEGITNVEHLSERLFLFLSLK